jgi:hypothetical protein
MQQKCCAFIFRNDFKTMGIHFTLKQWTNNDVQLIEIPKLRP